MSDALHKPVCSAALRAMLNKWMPRQEVSETILRTPSGKLLRALYVEDCPIQVGAVGARAT